MHPMLNEGVSLGIHRGRNARFGRYFACNDRGQEFAISKRLYNALFEADGTHPLNLPNNGQDILPTLKKHGLVRTSRFVRDGVINRLILLPIGNRMKAGLPKWRTITLLLPFLSIALFVTGCLLLRTKGGRNGGDLNLLVFYGLYVLSIIAHEFGHMVANLACGQKVSDVGLLLFLVVPIAAYAALEDESDLSKTERVQLALAGIEMNLLIAGICLLLSLLNTSFDITFIMVANINVFLAVVNLLPAPGLDGEGALSALLGMESVGAEAKKWLCNKKRRKWLLKSGLPGYIYCFVFVLTFISKIVLWLVHGVGIALWFLM